MVITDPMPTSVWDSLKEASEYVDIERKLISPPTIYPATTASITVAPGVLTAGSPTISRKVTEFQVHRRVNGPTLRDSNPVELMKKIRADFARQVVDKLLASSAIEITSVKSDKNDSVTFTATLRVETKP